jgi:hypothetical protein
MFLVILEFDLKVVFVVLMLADTALYKFLLVGFETGLYSLISKFVAIFDDELFSIFEGFI